MSRAAQTAPWVLSVLLAGALIGIVATQRLGRGPAPVLAPPAPPAARGARGGTPGQESAYPTVVRVKVALDGDSLLLDDDREVRLIGIDTPERGEPLADESRTWAKNLLDGQPVRLEYDEERKDRYDRLLAYVYLRNGAGGEKFVNAELVRLGFARSYPHRPNERHKAEFLRLQKEAREAGRGLWGLPSASDRGEVIGSTSRYHRSDCRHVAGIGKPRPFASPAAAMDAGLSACRSCKP